MKKLLLVLILLPLISFSQIEVLETERSEKPVLIGKVGALGTTDIKCLKYENANMYAFLYRDIKFKQITDFKSFSFQDEDNSFDKLYDVLIDHIHNPPGDKDKITKIKLPKGFLWIRHITAFGKTNISLGHSVTENAEVVGFSRWLTEKQVKKLFGK